MNKLKQAALAAFFVSIATPASAETQCAEWASMTQILVARWQGDSRFQGKTAKDVKDNLSQVMAGHPELPIALTMVDYAYKHRTQDPVKVWKDVFSACSVGKGTI